MTPRRLLGSTGLAVSTVGLGCGALGDTRVSGEAAEALVRRAHALGVNVFDAAPSYGDAEEKLGRALAAERDDVVLVTKGGYGVEGVADWTRECIARGIDRALGRLRTDRIDVFLLHSCPLERLARGDLLEELALAKRAGKVRAFGYSGDNEALAWAAREPAIDVVEASLNVVDQSSLASIEIAARRGAGVIVKRAVANAAWTHAERPARADVAIYWERARAIGFGGYDAFDVALRFAAFSPGVASVLVGTANPANLEHAVRSASAGSLATERVRAIAGAFAPHKAAWPGVI